MKRLLLFFTIALTNFNISLSQVPQSERDALITLYNETQGSLWTANTNWNTVNPVSSWYGITTSFINGVEHVTKIELYSNNLFFDIPSEVGEFPYLDYLDLSFNNLGGKIPSEIGNLQNLTILFLEANELSGTIPSDIAAIPNLTVFSVYDNSLNGTIPDFTDLANGTLEILWIYNNKFQFGDFENEFSSYQSIPNFSYSPQKLIGEPYSEALEIGNSTIFNTNVNGSQNSYNWYRINADGSEGGFIGSGENINITINTADDYNWFYFYEATSNLIPNLTLRSEFFTIGALPSNHPDYDALIAVYNALNGLDWDITKPIHNWSSNFDIAFDPISDRVTGLGITSINNTPITGTIPPEIGDLTELNELDLFLEDLSGEIPIELWSLTKLKTLFLGAQASKQLLLTNGIPPEIANLQDLEWLNLTGIPLTQPLQPELFNLPNLLRLRIVECGLTGTLPAGLAGISDVLASGNEFEGAIPQEFLDAVGNTNLNITNNYFNFANLEPLIQASNYSRLTYSPQRTKDVSQNLEFAPGSNIILNIDDTSLNKAVSSKGVGDEYQWYKDNIAINGANAISYTIVSAQESDSGVYYCEITNDLLPDLTINRANITLLIDAALSTEELTINNIYIYPNPTKNILNIKLNNYDKADASLYDISGRLVLKQKLNSETSKINTSQLNSGMYLMQIKTENTIITKRVIKE